QLHLWLGLSSSVILFLVCLSGTVLVFQEEILELYEPQKYTFSAPDSQKIATLENLISGLELQTKGQVTNVTIPSKLNRAYQFTVKTNPEERRGKRYSVNPYTGEVLNNPDEKPGWFFIFFRMHRWLLLDPEIGRPIVG